MVTLELMDLKTKTNKMKTIAEQLKHDFSKGALRLYDSNGNIIYYENSDGYWVKREFDSNGNKVYYENSNGTWRKQEYDSNGNEIYYEDSDGFWSKRKYDSNGNEIYYEDSDGFWYKSEYDSNGNEIYFETSNGYIKDNRLKQSCDGKIVEIEGRNYKLVELD
jgi:hypothetical protein